MCMLIKFKILHSKWKIEDTHSTFNMDLMRGMEYGICLISLQNYYFFSIMQVA